MNWKPPRDAAARARQLDAAAARSHPPVALLGVPPVSATDATGAASTQLDGRSPESRAFLEREFPEGAVGAARRRSPGGTCCTLLGASLSLAGLAACRRPVEHIVPYVNAPEAGHPGHPAALRDDDAVRHAAPTASSSRATRGGRRRSRATSCTRRASARRAPASRRRSSTSTIPTARSVVLRRGAAVELGGRSSAAWDERREAARARDGGAGLAVLAAAPFVLADPRRACASALRAALPAAHASRSYDAGQRRERARGPRARPPGAPRCRCYHLEQARGRSSRSTPTSCSPTPR